MLSDEIRDLYDGYYGSKIHKKRAISAKDSIREIQRVSMGRKFDHLLDVGAGEGSVLQEIEASGFANDLTVVEISTSGIDAIKNRDLSSLADIQNFDGYEIPYPDKTFDVALAIYVLEHVEHERMFLRELQRVSNRVIVAVPLEHTLRIRKSRAAAKEIGHINFYTMETFRNILETSGLQIENAHAFATSREYEVFLSPRMGRLKYLVRNFALKINPTLACHMFTYMGIAMCKCR